MQHGRNSPKANVFFTTTKKVYGPIFFPESILDDLLWHVGKLADSPVE
jgi:hypothetical protein